jgi:hypothetical protein
MRMIPTGTGTGGARRRGVIALACMTLGCLALVPQAPSAALPAPSPPSVNDVHAYEVTLSSAQLVGYVNPRNAATSYYFQYGPTTAYGSQTPAGSAGSGTSEARASAPVAGLESGTIYHFRLVATNSAGTTIGPDHQFTTVRVPLAFQVSASPNPVALGGSLTIQGTLSGSGSAGRELQLQMNPFPFADGMMPYGSPVTTDAAGHFSFAVASLMESARFRVATVGAPVATSAVVSEGVSVRVALHARRLRLGGHGRRLYRFYGTVTPVDLGARAIFELLRPGGRTLVVGATSVKRGNAHSCRFSSVVRIRRPGLYEALVIVSNGRNASGHSDPLRIR